MWQLYVEKLNVLKYKISIYEHSKNILPQAIIVENDAELKTLNVPIGTFAYVKN